VGNTPGGDQPRANRELGARADAAPGRAARPRRMGRRGWPASLDARRSTRRGPGSGADQRGLVCVGRDRRSVPSLRGDAGDVAGEIRLDAAISRSVIAGTMPRRKLSFSARSRSGHSAAPARRVSLRGGITPRAARPKSCGPRSGRPGR
jgi:hypothetical protein